jgi:hypothetical protein
MQNDFLSKLFDKLLENSYYPKYQMERRVDIFFNFFLPDIIKHVFGEEYEPDFIIPELPIKSPDSNRSANLDYFVVCRKMKTAFLVELKTYDYSYDPIQLKRYGKMQKDGIAKIKGDVEQIVKSTSSIFLPSYENLRDMLSTIPDDIQLELVYLLPEYAIKKLQKVADEEGIKVRFITLESLKKLDINSPYAEAWDIFRTSNLL